MTIPKKLEEKRDLLALGRAEKFWGERGSLEQEEQNSFDDITTDYKSGWNDCANLLLPEIKKLEEALMHSKVGFYSVSFVIDSSDLKMNMINLGIHCKSQEHKIDEALKSLREFLRSESDNG